LVFAAPANFFSLADASQAALASRSHFVVETLQSRSGELLLIGLRLAGGVLSRGAECRERKKRGKDDDFHDLNLQLSDSLSSLNFALLYGTAQTRERDALMVLAP
ncbi:MAG: hypothetical protein ACJ8CO_01360, partial [Microvirga sp.]